MVSCENPDARKTLEAIVGGELPNPVKSLLHLWEQKIFNPWEVLVQSAAILNPEVMMELTEEALLRPLHSLLLCSEQASILS